MAQAFEKVSLWNVEAGPQTEKQKKQSFSERNYEILCLRATPRS